MNAFDWERCARFLRKTRAPLRRSRWLLLHTCLLGAWPLPLGCTENVAPDRAHERPLLVTQRVTATIRREASQLVRLEAEHEALLATPEHPFATPGSGWVSAGRLVPGDWVVSERFAAVRLSSARSEFSARPVPVFNLSVASSHAYLVGTEGLLVHNTRCNPAPTSHRAAIEQAIRERDELTREARALVRTTPMSPRLSELQILRRRLQIRIDFWRKTERKEQGMATLRKVDRTRNRYESELTSAQDALEQAQNELAELAGRPPPSEEEEAAFAARKGELERQIQTLAHRADRASRILSGLRELAELEEQSPATEVDRQALEERKNTLRTQIKLEQGRAAAVKYARAKRATPEGRQELLQHSRNAKRRQHRTPAYLADTERPRDTLERLEDELASRSQAPPSEDRDARIHHLTDQIETMKRRVEVRREQARYNVQRRRALFGRKKKLAQGRDASELDGKLEQLELRLDELRIEHLRLRIRERLLARLDKTPWARPQQSVDEARLRDFERQLAGAIAGGAEREQQLADLERALDAMAPVQAEWSESVLSEAQDVDQVLSDPLELLPEPPFPERAAELLAGYELLQQELREERAAVDVAVSTLAQEHASIQTTQAGSSSGPAWQDRLRDIGEEQRRLRAQWRARVQSRLDGARSQLHALQSVERLRDETVEHELAREIALFERELQRSD